MIKEFEFAPKQSLVQMMLIEVVNSLLQIYIWRRKCKTPIKILTGHSMTVNSVTWNHAKPHMLASASDDHTVRIWISGTTLTKQETK